MKTNYALTKETLDFYRCLVSLGFSFDTAMEQLKEIYEHNTEFYMNQK